MNKWSMRKGMWFIVFVLMSFVTNAQDSTRAWYISTNVMAPVAGWHKQNAIATALVPVFSNLEYGVTISAGNRKFDHASELRLTYGSSNPFNVIPQVQYNYHYYLWDHVKQNNSGWYVGGSSKYWIYANTETATQLHSVSAGAVLGYSHQIGKILFDYRMVQPLAIYSASSIEHTQAAFAFQLSPMPEFSPVLPLFSINIGYWISRPE